MTCKEPESSKKTSSKKTKANAKAREVKTTGEMKKPIGSRDRDEGGEAGRIDNPEYRWLEGELRRTK